MQFSSVLMTAATAGRGGGGPGSLNALTLSGYNATEQISAAGGLDSQGVRDGPGDVVGTIIGKTSGSTLSLVVTAGGRFYYDAAGPYIRIDAPLNYETKTSHVIRIRETLGANVRETDLTINVTNWTESGGTPSPGTWLYYHLILRTDLNKLMPGDENWFQSLTLYNDIDGSGDTIAEMPTGVGIRINSGGTYVPVAGNTVTGATSGATGVIQAVNLQSGAWASGNAVGTLVLTSRTGTFVNAETINIGANNDVGTITNFNETGLLLNVAVYHYRAAFTDTVKTIDFYMDNLYASEAAARAQVDKYTTALGALPKVTRENYKFIRCPKADGSFNAENIGKFWTLWGDRADVRIAQGKLEELFFHESTHAALQNQVATYGGIGLPLLYSSNPPSPVINPAWQAAVDADGGRYLTEYGQSNAITNDPGEDFAESAQISWSVLKYPERFPPVELADILAHIPNRIAFFQSVYGL